MAIAHLTGGATRAFSSKKLADDDRRDGAPFFCFAEYFWSFVSWFLVQEQWAQWLHDYSFGMLLA
jgi:hypothetical protein